jgi:hypothetical protein
VAVDGEEQSDCADLEEKGYEVVGHGGHGVVPDRVLDTRRLERLTEDLLPLAALDSARPLRMTGVDW